MGTKEASDKLLLFLVLSFFLSMTSCQQSHRLCNDSLILVNKWMSPDQSKILVSYKFDTGAFGYSQTFNALIPESEINHDLSKYLLPDHYQPVQWEKDGSLTVRICYVYWLRLGQDFHNSKDKDFLYGTPINVEIYDETAGLERKIEADLPSPNQKLRLVAYRYPNGGNLNKIHVSIVKNGELIPRHGNFYIGFNGHDGFLKGEWKNDKEIIFYTTSIAYNMVSKGEGEGFIKNTFGIKFQLVVEDQLLPKYLWVRD
jgi:hypothetical protein